MMQIGYSSTGTGWLSDLWRWRPSTGLWSWVGVSANHHYRISHTIGQMHVHVVCNRVRQCMIHLCQVNRHAEYIPSIIILQVERTRVVRVVVMHYTSLVALYPTNTHINRGMICT